ncbi:MAG: hypothetical protein V1771_01780 [Chloroflexota bacterium]
MRRLVLLLVALVFVLSACAAPQEDAHTPLAAESLVQEPQGQPTESTAPPGQVPGLGRGIQNVPNINVTQAYIIDGKRWGEIVWTLELPMSRYIYYRDKLRPQVFFDYVKMATDPQDDDIIDAIIRNIRDTAAAKGLDRKDQLSLVLSFVQSMTYSDDIVSTYRNEYARYPVETLFEKVSDCEDTSILAAAILTKMGFDVALILFEQFDHMGVGVDYYELEYGNSWIYEGRRYWYFETTGGRSLGWAPTEYAKTAAYVLPVTD